MTTAALNSLVLATVGGLIATVLAALLSYTAIKSNLRGKRFVEMIAVFPMVFPGLIFSLALLWAGITIFRPLWGTLWILLAAYIVVLLPRAARTITNSIFQLHDELEEVARTSGSGWLSTFRNITLPILRPSLTNAFILAFFQGYQLLGPAVLLATPGTTVLSVFLLSLWVNGHVTDVAAGAVIYGGLSVALVITAKFIFKAKL